MYDLLTGRNSNGDFYVAAPTGTGRMGVFSKRKLWGFRLSMGEATQLIKDLQDEVKRNTKDVRKVPDTQTEMDSVPSVQAQQDTPQRSLDERQNTL